MAGVFFTLILTVRQMMRQLGRAYRRSWRSALILLLTVTVILPPTHVLATNDPLDSEPPEGPGPPPCPDCATVCPITPGVPSPPNNDASPQFDVPDPIYLHKGMAIESEVDLHLELQSIDWTFSRSLGNLSTGWMFDTAQMSWSFDLTTPTDKGSILLKTRAFSMLRFENQNDLLDNNDNPIPPNFQATSDTNLKVTLDALAMPQDELGNYLTPIVKYATFSERQYLSRSHRFKPDRVWIFNGNDPLESANYQNYEYLKLRELTNAEWQAANKHGYQYSYDPNNNHNLLTIVTPDAVGDPYTISFTWSGDQLDAIEVKDSDDVVVQRVDYTYINSGNAGYLGPIGSLAQVQVTTKGSSGNIIRYTQYRYYSGSPHGHKLKAVYKHDAVVRAMTAFGVTSPNDLFTKSDNEITGPDMQDYATRRFGYDAFSPGTPFSSTETNVVTKYGGSGATGDTNGVRSEIVGSGCSSCGGGNNATVTKWYTYINTPNAGSSNQNDVTRIVVEDTVGSDNAAKYRTIYGLNNTGRLLRKAFVEDPTGSPKFWCESWKMATGTVDHRVGEYREPSAHNVTETNIQKFLDPLDGTNDSETLKNNEGLIHIYGYYNGHRSSEHLKIGNGSESTFAVMSYTFDPMVSGDLPSGSVYYPTINSADARTTGYTYEFYDDPDNTKLKMRTTTLPGIKTSENGAGETVQAEIFEYYDTYGRLRWKLDAEGYLSYYSYDPVHGKLAYMVQDVNVSNIVNNSDYWDAESVGEADDTTLERADDLPDPLHLVTEYYYDTNGRLVKTVEPGGAVHCTAYLNDKTIRFPYWTGSTTLMPIEVTYQSDGVNVTDSYQIKAGYNSSYITTSSGIPVNVTNVTKADYVSWTHINRNGVNGRIDSIDRYHDIPASGDALITHYYRTYFQYDALGRREHTIETVSGESMTGYVEQITKNVHDLRGRVTEAWKGISSAGNDFTSSMPTLTKIRDIVYDGGLVGNGHVTKVKNYFGTGTNDYTGMNYYRNVRGHLRGTEPIYYDGSEKNDKGPYTVYDLDWAGHVIATAIYEQQPNWSILASTTMAPNPEYISSNSSNRRSVQKTYYDGLGRPYLTERYKGTGPEHLASRRCYDRNDNLVAVAEDYGDASSLGKTTEMAYDGAGRQYQTRTVLSMSKTPYSTDEATEGKFLYRAPDPATILTASTGDDGVMEIDHSVFDARGNVIHRHMFEANHDDTNGIHMSADKYVRRTVYNWYDGADRITTSADYGSGNGNNSPDRWGYAALPSYPSSAPTDSGLMQLVTEYAYNADTGRLELMTDPANRKTKMFFDDLGRRSYIAKNWADFTPETGTGDSTDKSRDRVTKFTYNGLNDLTTLVAMDADANGNLSDNQTTTFEYGDPIFADRVTGEIYPDSSSGTDKITFEYSIDGVLKTRTDQRTTTTAMDYNERRQLKLTKVTSLGGADSHIQSIGYTHDNIGRVTKITSYAGNDGVTGPVRNDVKLTYNDFNQVIKSEQSHEGTVESLMSPPSVEYIYDDTPNNNVFQYRHRLSKVSYPGAGRVLFYDYDTANAANPPNRLSRPKSIRATNASGAEWATYGFSGRRRLAVVDYADIDVKLSYHGSTGSYPGRDRFGRVVDQYWDSYGSAQDPDRVHYGYDYAGNRTYRDVDSAIYSYMTDKQDHAYTYDGLHRLKTFDEGTVNTGTATITGTPSLGQTWTLDALGNWKNFVFNFNGFTILNQNRDVSGANEITSASSWTTPAYDAAGNMTTITHPVNLTSGYTATYDAWNRLVKLVDGSNTIAEYEYDGLNRRNVKSVYASGTLDHRQHFYYNENWQTLEVRKEVSATEDPDPLEQYVWHPYYVDALASRFYDADTDGSNVAQHYFAHDANFNVTAVLDTSGAVIERYRYLPYGPVTVIEPDFSNDPDGKSDVANPYTFTGRRFDPESGLYYYRNRYYHAVLGTFVSRDPIDYAAGDENLYRYVNNSPGNQLDPSGLLAPDPVTTTTIGSLLGPHGALIGAGIGAGILIGGTIIWYFWPDGPEPGPGPEPEPEPKPQPPQKPGPGPGPGPGPKPDGGGGSGGGGGDGGGPSDPDCPDEPCPDDWASILNQLEQEAKHLQDLLNNSQGKPAAIRQKYAELLKERNDEISDLKRRCAHHLN